MRKVRSAHIVAIVFGIFLLGGIVGFFNLNAFIKPVVASFLKWNGEKSVSKNITDIEENIESLINENIGFKTTFIQANGFAQKLLGKRVIDDVNPESSIIRLDNGYISFVAKEIDDSSLKAKANSISHLNSFLTEKGIDFLYIQTPYKIAEDEPMLPVGVKDHSVSNANRLCSMLNEENVYVLNLVDVIYKQNIDWYSMFFKTDHHWTNEAAFWAYGEIAKTLSNDFNFEIDEKYSNIDNYSIRRYEKAFLGTQGKRVGSTYAGLDDINFIIPKFETSLEYYCPSKNSHRSGTFEDTLLFEEAAITGDIFNDFCYAASLGGDFGYLKITNKLNPDGKKVLLIKDSFANPVATFMALGVSELEVVDLRYFESEMNMSVTEYIAESNPDTVLMLYNPNALKDDTFFKY